MKNPTRLTSIIRQTGAELNRHPKLPHWFNWLSIAAVLFLASLTAEAQIVYTFTDDGAGGTTVTGSGTATIPDRGRSDTGVGWNSSDFPDAHYFKHNASHPVSPNPTGRNDEATGGSLVLSVAGSGDYPHRFLFTDSTTILLVNQRPGPEDAPSGDATLSGSNSYPTFSPTDWPIPSGTIDVFGDNTILFVFVGPPAPAPAMIYQPDLLIGTQRSNLQVDGFYTGQAARQTIRTRQLRGRKAAMVTVPLEIQNDGNVPDRIRVRFRLEVLDSLGGGKVGTGPRFRRQIFAFDADGRRNVTESIQTQGILLGPGESQPLLFKLTVRRVPARRISRRTTWLFAVSEGDPSKIDSGRAIIRVRK